MGRRASWRWSRDAYAGLDRRTRRCDPAQLGASGTPAGRAGRSAGSITVTMHVRVERGLARARSHCCRTAASPTAAARASTSGTSAASWSRLGHEVEVFSGQPYPDLDDGRAAHRGAEPRPLPRARPVPVPQPSRVPRPHRRRGVARPCARPGSPSRRRSARASRGCCADRRRRLRRRPRQPGARLRDARHRASRAAAGHDASTTRSPSTAAIDLAAAPDLAQAADAAPLVRLPADAGQGRPRRRREILTPSESSRARHRRATSASTRPGSR